MTKFWMHKLVEVWTKIALRDDSAKGVQSYPMKNEGNIGDNVVLTKISCSFTYRNRTITPALLHRFSNERRHRKGPSAEWQRGHVSHRCNVDCHKKGGIAFVTCTMCTIQWPMTRQHSKMIWSEMWRTSNSLRNVGCEDSIDREGEV